MRRPLVPSFVPCLLVFGLPACGAPKGSEPAESAKTAAPAAAAAEPANEPGPKAPSAQPAAAAKDPKVAQTAEVGKPAPAFELVDLDGKTHRLADHAGKIVVLEWFNPECPFIKYAHTKGPLSDLAKRLAGDDLVFLAINSGAPGKQGHGVEVNRKAVEAFGIDHPVLLDPDGTVGHAYGARKTPHMFVVDAKGTLVYAGALDNAPMGEVDGEGPHVVYVEQAVAALRAGKAVPTPTTPPYGCSVKYGS